MMTWSYFRSRFIAYFFLGAMVTASLPALAEGEAKVGPLDSQALSCDDTFITAQMMMAIHLLPHRLDDHFSQKILTNILMDFDPYKTILSNGVAARLRATYGQRLDNNLLDENCATIIKLFTALNAIYLSYSKKLLRSIESKSLDFSDPEFINANPLKIKYTTSREELRDRRRRALKYNILRLGYSSANNAVDIGAGKRIFLSKTRKRIERPPFDGAAEMNSAFLRAFARTLDAHSDYFDEKELSDFRVATSLSMVGVGVVITEERGMFSIVKVISGSPADGKLKPADLIVAGSDERGKMVPFFGMSLEGVIDILRGSEGSLIKLTIKSGANGKLRKVRITRRAIELTDERVTSRIIKKITRDNNSKRVRVGVLTVPSFYLDFEKRDQKAADFRRVSEDARLAVTDLIKRGINSLVVDLRNNGGGSLEEAVRFVGLFLSGKSVVQVRNFSGVISRLGSPRDVITWRGPLVVLINKSSASASEIVAGALKDHGRALIVGDRRTFGKGSVQTLQSILPQKGAVKITTAQFFSPAGGSSQIKGVVSDIQIPSTSDLGETGEHTLGPDVLPWDLIPGTLDLPLFEDDGSFAAAKRKSRDRIKKNKALVSIPAPPDFDRVGLTVKLFIGSNTPDEDLGPEAPDSQLEEAVNIAADLAPSSR
jgi:carboxyl-terminal processing protease